MLSFQREFMIFLIPLPLSLSLSVFSHACRLFSTLSLPHSPPPPPPRKMSKNQKKKPYVKDKYNPKPEDMIRYFAWRVSVYLPLR